MLVTLYDERTLLGVPEYEKIVQLLLWSSDQVCVPPQARLRQDLPEKIGKSFTANLHEFADAGLLTTYDVEDAPRVKAQGMISLPSKSRKMVPREDYVSLFHDVRASTLRYREQLNAASQQHGMRLEGVTEYVTLQSHLWTIGLAGLLGSGQALISDRRSAAFMQQVEKSQRAAELRPPAIEALMRLNDIGPLHNLSTEDILKLRHYLPQVRKFLDKTIDEVTLRRPLAPVEELRADVVNQVMHEYFELYRDLQKSTPQRARSLGADVVVSILGYLYPPLSIIAFARPLAEWVESRHGRNRVMVFNMKLRKMTQR